MICSMFSAVLRDQLVSSAEPLATDITELGENGRPPAESEVNLATFLRGGQPSTTPAVSDDSRHNLPGSLKGLSIQIKHFSFYLLVWSSFFSVFSLLVRFCCFGLV